MMTGRMATSGAFARAGRGVVLVVRDPVAHVARGADAAEIAPRALREVPEVRGVGGIDGLPSRARRGDGRSDRPMRARLQLEPSDIRGRVLDEHTGRAR